MCLLLLIYYSAFAQNDFSGIIKYKMTVEGSRNPLTDSMTVIFSKQKVKVILYLPDLKNKGRILERIFIDDFAARKSLVLNTESKTYTIDTLNSNPKYDFINTGKIGGSNNIICFQYRADSTKLDRERILSVNCLAGINYRNSIIANYFFLSIQPIIIDNRIVMDFTVTQPGGIKQKISVADVKKIPDVESYFNLTEYKKIR